MNTSWLGARRRRGVSRCAFLTLFAAIACGSLALFAPSARASCPTGSVTFSSAGAEQCYSVPAGVATVHVVAVGAPGAPSVTITPPPIASIVSPATGSSHKEGQSVPTTFSCAESSGGSGLASCNDSNDTSTAGGGAGRLDTSTPGTRTYTVTAASTDGQTGTASITYTVVRQLRITIGTSRALVVNGKTTIRLRCHRGTFAGVCRGTLTLTIRRLVHHGNSVTFAIAALAIHGYAVPAGHSRVVTLKLAAAAVQRLSNSPHQRLPVRATATVGGGNPAIRAITLRL